MVADSGDPGCLFQMASCKALCRLGPGGQRPLVTLWFCDTTESEPGALRATHGQRESSVDGEPTVHRTLLQGHGGDSKRDEMHSLIPKGQVGRSKVYIVQEQSQTKAVRVRV